MGLSLSAVNRDYGFTEDGDDKKGNECYCSTDTGYSSYKFFREDFMKFLTDGRIENFDELFSAKYLPNGYWYNDKYTVLMCIEDFEEDNRDNPKVKDYLDRLEKIKEEFLDLFDCLPFIMHNDCEGEMPYEQLVSLVPHLKFYHEQTGKAWGYSGWDYDFVQDLIDCCEEAIEHKGKLYFS